MISIRLVRIGARHKPYYRIVVIDSKRASQSKTKDYIGYYNPLTEPPEVKIDLDKANFWLKQGAQTSQTVQALLHKVTKATKLSSLQNSKT